MMSLSSAHGLVVSLKLYSKLMIVDVAAAWRFDVESNRQMVSVPSHQPLLHLHTVSCC